MLQENSLCREVQQLGLAAIVVSKVIDLAYW